MKTEFEVLNPSHQKYQKGKLVFEFEENGVTLKKLNFYIDKEYFYITMIFLYERSISSNWIFQKPNSLKALNNEELEQISCLTRDVLDNFFIESSFQNLLFVMDHQIHIYKQLTQTKPDAITKEKLIAELKKANPLIKRINKARSKYLNCCSK